MSNYLTISAVTTVLKYILEQEIQDELDNISLDISLKAPHDISLQAGEGGLNIFLYQVTLNSGYANYDLPRRDARGRLISKPLVGLDLHYLLTPFSKENDEILIQQILASTIRILHEKSVLTRQIIEDAFDSIRTLDQTNKILNSDLHEQTESVKLIYKPLSLEEITKLWSSNFQTNYRLSIAYLATLVLIDSKKEPIRQLPVHEPKILVKQFRYPIIERIEPNIIQWDANAANRNVHIIGKNLSSDNLKVVIGGLEVPSVLITRTTNERITVNLPDNLPAGIKILKIIHGISDDENNNMTGNSQHLAFESNTSIFVLIPRIITEFPLQIVRGTILDLDLKPPLKEKQKVEVMIGDKIFSQYLGNDQTFPIETIKINTNDFPIGKSLFRLRIDGAESSLVYGPDPLRPTDKTYIGPEIEVIKPLDV